MGFEMKSAILFLTAVMILAAAVPARAIDDPTKGKPFFPWIWNDQFKPTLQHSLDLGGIGILSAGAVGTIGAHQYDADVSDSVARKTFMDDKTSGTLGTIGGGAFGLGVVVVQMFVDQPNGLKHGRALVLTSLSHVSLAFVAHRERPLGSQDYLGFASSWPSGHASSAFATAESLAYAYGWWVGVPANALAIAICAGRVAENRHWLSDVVAGAALGIFWAHASNNADQLAPDPTAWQFTPVPFENGLGFTLAKHF
jgi:hypothetical protein